MNLVLTRHWFTDGDWNIAPEGLSWIKQGSSVQVGNNVRMGAYVRFGDHVHLGDDVVLSDHVHLGDDVDVGNRGHLGSHVHMDDGAHIGDDVVLRGHMNLGNRGAVRAGVLLHDLGVTDGWRKTLADVNGVAYIGSGYHWFTLAQAINHWESHKQDRRVTMALLQGAIALAKHYNLKQE